MNKNLLYFFMATASILCTTQHTQASEQTMPVIRQMEKTVSDTPYMVVARIARTGVRDTPYLVFSTSPSSVYKEVEQALAGEKGSFKAELVFYAENGLPVRNETYFINKREE